MTLLRLFALVMEGFFEKSPVFGHLCTCALSRMCGLKPMFFVSLNSTSQPQNFPIWTPDASANSHHQEMERSQASFLASWDLAVFHGLLSDLKKITPSMECFEAWKLAQTPQDSLWGWGIHGFSGDRIFRHKFVGSQQKRRKT